MPDLLVPDGVGGHVTPSQLNVGDMSVPIGTVSWVPDGSNYDPIDVLPEWETVYAESNPFDPVRFNVVGSKIRTKSGSTRVDIFTAFTKHQPTDVELTVQFLYQETGGSTSYYWFPAAVRGQGATTYIAMRAFTNNGTPTIEVYERKGTFTKLGEVTSTDVRNKDVTLRVVGDKVSINIDGAWSPEWTTTVLGAGYVGMVDRASSADTDVLSKFTFTSDDLTTKPVEVWAPDGVGGHVKVWPADYMVEFTTGEDAILSTNTIPIPASRKAGDQLLVTVANSGSRSYSTPSGWTKVADAINSSGSCQLRQFSRISDGTETEFTITGVSRNIVWRVDVLRGVEFTEVARSIYSSVSNPTAPALTPSAPAHFSIQICGAEKYDDFADFESFPDGIPDNRSSMWHSEGAGAPGLFAGSAAIGALPAGVFLFNRSVRSVANTLVFTKT